MKWHGPLHKLKSDWTTQVAGYKYIGRVCKKDPDEAYDYFSKV